MDAFTLTNTRTHLLIPQSLWCSAPKKRWWRIACLKIWVDRDTCWFTQVITQVHSSPSFYKSPDALSPCSISQPLPWVVLSLCHNNSHHMQLPWQAEEALLRKIRAETLTSNSTLVVYFFSWVLRILWPTSFAYELQMVSRWIWTLSDV